jgi:hypothetical protein
MGGLARFADFMNLIVGSVLLGGSIPHVRCLSWRCLPGEPVLGGYILAGLNRFDIKS